MTQQVSMILVNDHWTIDFNDGSAPLVTPFDGSAPKGTLLATIQAQLPEFRVVFSDLKQGQRANIS